MKPTDILALLSLVVALISFVSVICMDGLTTRHLRKLQDEIDKIIKN